MARTFSDYSHGSSGGGSSTHEDEKTDYWSLSKCKRAYLDYVGSKREEIDEQRVARKYRHGAQYTAEQIQKLNERKQPVITINKVGPKIDSIVGLVEKLRKDPKAFPRTPQHAQGAELASAVLNFALDEATWKAKSPLAAEDCATSGISGIELNLMKTKEGITPDLDWVYSDDYFYDPRSYQLDFSDARFQGVAKWLDVDYAIELYPKSEDDIRAVNNQGLELTKDSDRDNRWFTEDTMGVLKQVRVVDIWYQHNGGWCYCTFIGSAKLIEGSSFLTDHKTQKTFCKYIMFSASSDHDGDRYGFVRWMKSIQDEVNQRRSKGLHELNTRRIIAEQGAFDDIEKTRKEAARPDGMIIRNPNTEAEFDDASKIANIEGHFKFLEHANNEIENFGPNRSMMGDQNIENNSGRAIALLQQASINQLGPYIISYSGWKLRVYRAVWNAIVQYWTGEKYIRVTDDEEVTQFVAVNQLMATPAGPQLVNALGELDVDIILDEGPDHVNAQADAYENLTVLAGQGVQFPPDVVIELSSLPHSLKKKILGKLEQAAQQPSPEMQAEQAKIMGQREQIALKKEQAAADIEMDTQKMGHQFFMEEQKFELEKRKTAAQLELEREKAGIQIELEERKAGAQANLEKEKAATQKDVEEFKAVTGANLERDKMNMQVEGEKQKKEQKVKDASNEAAVRAITELSKGLKEGFGTLEKAFLADTQLVRDKSGRAIAAKKVAP